MCLRNSIFSVQVSSVDIRVYPVSHIKNCSSNPKKNGNKKGLVLKAVFKLGSIEIIWGAALISYKRNTDVFNVICTKKVSTLVPFIYMLGFENEPSFN